MEIYGKESYEAEVTLTLYSGTNIERIFGNGRQSINDYEDFFQGVCDDLERAVKREFGGEAEASLSEMDMFLEGIGTPEDEDCFITCSIDLEGDFSIKGTYYPASPDCPEDYDWRDISKQEMERTIEKILFTLLDEEWRAFEFDAFVSCKIEEREPEMREAEDDLFL